MNDSREITALDLDASPELVLSDTALDVIALMRRGGPNSPGAPIDAALVAAELHVGLAEAQRALNELGRAFGVNRR